jgi:hypothetical protein
MKLTFARLIGIVSAHHEAAKGKEAVARVLAWLVSRGERTCTPRTSPYCKARARLPEAAELDLRALKITLGMDVLRCKTPEMVRKEVWAHLLAYNLIRLLMAQAAEQTGCTPRDLSFKGTLQTMKEFAERLLDARGPTCEQLHEWLLLAIAALPVNDRPDRVEPRARKRRPKQYPRLMQPRRVARLARKQLGAKFWGLGKCHSQRRYFCLLLVFFCLPQLQGLP